MGVEVSREPVGINTQPTFSPESIREASLPRLWGESKEDLDLYIRRHPPTRVTRLENEVVWDTWERYQGKFYFDPNYGWGSTGLTLFLMEQGYYSVGTYPMGELSVDGIGKT